MTIIHRSTSQIRNPRHRWWGFDAHPVFDAHLVFGAYVVFVGLALLPLLFASVPPLIDFANHLARMAVISNPDPEAAVTTNYRVDWRVLPNLSMDLVVPVLARIMPLETAGRVFIATTMILLVAGTALLHRTLHGQTGLWPLSSVLFLYNNLLWAGLVNCLFGLGVTLLAFSLWIISATWPMLLRLGVFAIIATVIFLLHFFALGVFGLLVVSYELGLALSERPHILRNLIRRALVLLQFVPTAVLWLLWITSKSNLYTA